MYDRVKPSDDVRSLPGELLLQAEASTLKHLKTQAARGWMGGKF